MRAWRSGRKPNLGKAFSPIAAFCAVSGLKTHGLCHQQCPNQEHLCFCAD
jgi:hypothetical protein